MIYNISHMHTLIKLIRLSQTQNLVIYLGRKFIYVFSWWHPIFHWTIKIFRKFELPKYPSKTLSAVPTICYIVLSISGGGPHKLALSVWLVKNCLSNLSSDLLNQQCFFLPQKLSVRIEEYHLFQLQLCHFDLQMAGGIGEVTSGPFPHCSLDCRWLLCWGQVRHQHPVRCIIANVQFLGFFLATWIWGGVTYGWP